jgi:hypothetical protein
LDASYLPLQKCWQAWRLLLVVGGCPACGSAGNDRPDGRFRSARTAPVGPTHTVATAADAAACDIPAYRLHLLDQDWEAALFVQKCPRCFTAVLADG